MTSEQEKAIKRLEKRIKDNEDYKTTQVWLTDDVSAVYTVLNMLKENSEEIKNYKKRNKDLSNQILMLYKEQDNNAARIEKKNAEIEKKDKIIDLMANSFAEEGFYSEHCQTLIDNEICPNDCDKCVKQYFERKSEEWKKI